MPANSSTTADLTDLARQMQSAMAQGHVDHLRALAKQYNRKLQWIGGLLLGEDTAPDAVDRERLFHQAWEESQALLQAARFFQAETRRKIENLSRRRASQGRLHSGYAPGAKRLGVATRL